MEQVGVEPTSTDCAARLDPFRYQICPAFLVYYTVASVPPTLLLRALDDLAECGLLFRELLL